MAGGIAQSVFDLIRPVVEQCGVKLWDVKYVKEGASYFLRIYIDKENGIDINDCTDVSHAIDPVIDEADPIKDSYYLEVCSPGLERELTRPEHFERFTGSDITLKLYKAFNGIKNLKCKLLSFEDGNAQVELQNGEKVLFEKKDISSARLDDADFSK